MKIRAQWIHADVISEKNEQKEAFPCSAMPIGEYRENDGISRIPFGNQHVVKTAKKHQ